MMIKSLLLPLLILGFSQAFARGESFICPILNMGPYGNGGDYMYYSLLHEEDDPTCNNGVPVMYIGGPGEEAYCEMNNGCSACIGLGDGERPVSSTKPAIEAAVSRSGRNCFTQLAMPAQQQSIHFDMPFLPDHAFDPSDPQFNDIPHTGLVLGGRSPRTQRNEMATLHVRRGLRIDGKAAVLQSVEATIALNHEGSEETTNRTVTVGLGVECRRHDGLSPLMVKSISVASAYRKKADSTGTTLVKIDLTEDEGTKRDGLLLVESVNGSTYYLRVKKTSDWISP